jgi:hypothetical protein
MWIAFAAREFPQFPLVLCQSVPALYSARAAANPRLFAPGELDCSAETTARHADLGQIVPLVNVLCPPCSRISKSLKNISDTNIIVK